MPAKVNIVNGHFQDLEGNDLSNGYLTFELTQNASVNDSIVCSDATVTIALDVNGDVVSGSYLWGNDQMTPINSFYRVTGYTVEGQIVFGPNNQQIIGDGGTFDLGTWVPNQIVWS